MKYRQHRLDNGLEILGECNPQAHALSVGFFVKAGARDEQTEIGGVSHFLEHMVFKGTPSRSAEDVNRELDEMGSQSNARTSEESTIYHAGILPDFQTPLIELLSDIMRPSLRKEDFETEKQVIIEEIMMYDDQPPYGGYERIMAEFFGEHPLRQSVLGTVESVGGLTSNRMMDYFHQRYSPNNMALAVAGQVDFERLIADCERCCGHWESFEAERKIRPANPRNGFASMHKAESTQQYILQLAHGPAAEDDDRFAARVLATILGDDSGSRLYWEFLDTGRAESGGIGNYEYDGTGAILTYLCCAPEQSQDNLNRLQLLQTNAVENGISQRELELAKSKIASRIILAAERTENRMFSVGSQWLRQQEFKSPKEIAQLYEEVTLDEVQSVVQKYPLHRNMTLCVGPQVDLQAPALV